MLECWIPVIDHLLLLYLYSSRGLVICIYNDKIFFVVNKDITCVITFNRLRACASYLCMYDVLYFNPVLWKPFPLSLPKSNLIL